MLTRVVKDVLHRCGYALVPNRQVLEPVYVMDLERDRVFQEIYATCRNFSLTSPSRMYALYQAVAYVARHDVPGAIVECGVWRGGSAMVAALTLKQLGVTDRDIYLYDTFEGMSEPTERDLDFADTRAAELMPSYGWVRAGLDDVRANLRSTGYPADRLVFVKGKVEDTLPGTMPTQVALLRLDTDWYESTYQELVHLYPRLERRGVLIVDDYGHWQGARQAVDRYFEEAGVAMLLNRIDYTGRIGVKLD